MKKQYKMPTATIYTVMNRSVLTTSILNYSGSNKGTSIKTAETKRLNNPVVDNNLWDEQW